MIYLDNAATTQIDPEVVEAMMPYLGERYGNPGSIYKHGREALNAVEEARANVAKLINAEPEQIVFTSGGTESNNMVIKNAVLNEGKRLIVSTNIEHDSILRSIESTGRGFLVGVESNGVVNPDKIESMFDYGCGLVSVMCVNNELGSINPIKEIARRCHDRGILFHTDCVQAICCMDIDVKDIDCDFLSMSSHKIHGAKGVGALYVKDFSKISPLISGGSAQEGGFRGGTENVAGIVGFGKAANLQTTYLRGLRGVKPTMKDAFHQALTNKLKELGCDINIRVNSDINNVSRILNITLEGIDSETLVLMLDSKDICVSSGSACTSHESTPSHVLKAIGLSDEDAHNSIRISFSRNTTDSEVRYAADVMAQCVNILRNVCK